MSDKKDSNDDDIDFDITRIPTKNISSSNTDDTRVNARDLENRTQLKKAQQKQSNDVTRAKARKLRSNNNNSQLPFSESPSGRKLPFSSNNSDSATFSNPAHTSQIVLKNRFLLDETLGVGGMGVVYKAIDKRKVEAKDRNPYIAVKILSEDFRQHPDAFMALQREARKSQSIAHPNIVNVHDFDRDGDTVFMTMEYMEGQPLDKLLKANRGVGLVTDQANRIFKDICAALEHAHKEYIVHADFKPGNIFVTNSGVTKVFDFGIARAVAQADKHVHHHDKSVFDPQTLGALTPAYASPEMLKGATPTAQDDIYALGCVTYEMFSGEHPFKRLQADQAMEQKLKPKKIKSLSKQQWKALLKALAFNREKRTATVYDFLWEFTQIKKSPVKKLVSMAAALALGVGLYSQFIYQKELSPEDLKAQLEQQIKKDLLKENITTLLSSNSFTNLWEADIWKQIQAGRVMLGLKDKWLVESEAEVIEIYLHNIGKRREKIQLTDAKNILKRAERYRGYEDLLDNERIAIDDAFAKLDTRERLAEEKRQKALEKARKLAASKKAQQKKKKTKKIVKAPAPVKQVEKPKDVFALAIVNIKQQLRCKKDINTRNLEEAVTQAKSINQQKFKKESARIVNSLAICIEKIGKRNSNRAEDLKLFAKRLFPGDRVISKIKINPVDPCNQNKAGLGARGKTGTCRDRFAAGGYGPRLVVIPSNKIHTAFAIGQYEVSIEEMNQYCKITGDCDRSPLSNNNLPITNISITQAKAYARWLSKKTGYRYRIPRNKEWVYAATAVNSDLDANRNCSMNSRGIIKGKSLEEVATGQKNKWGMVNHVGNAQEWVLINNIDLAAVGGAHTDPINQCQVESKRDHSGKPDMITSFRLVRELRK